jgi:hypothetical protein
MKESFVLRRKVNNCLKEKLDIYLLFDCFTKGCKESTISHSTKKMEKTMTWGQFNTKERDAILSCQVQL